MFSAVTASISSKILILDDTPGKLAETREMVASQELDILLYIALPTEKFTSFLSHARLSPIQIVFGIGRSEIGDKKGSSFLSLYWCSVSCFM